MVGKKTSSLKSLDCLIHLSLWCHSLHLTACLCSEAVWPTCPMGLVLVMKVQRVEKKFHSGLFSSIFSFWWHLEDWASFSVCFQIQKPSICWALQSQWDFTCVNLGRIWVFVAREGKPVIIFSFCSNPEKFLPSIKTIGQTMSISFRETASS